MSALLTTIHIIICFILILAVLLQSGKSADLAGAFGGVGSKTVFGPRGAATILSKVTTICAVLFMITSLGLWMLSAKGTRSVIKGEETVEKEEAPVTETEKKEAKTPETKGKQQQKQEEEETEKAKEEKRS